MFYDTSQWPCLNWSFRLIATLQNNKFVFLECRSEVDRRVGAWLGEITGLFQWLQNIDAVKMDKHPLNISGLLRATHPPKVQGNQLTLFLLHPT